MRYLPKGSESWKSHTYWKVHRFQKHTRPNPNYRSEKLKLNLKKYASVFQCLVFSAEVTTGWVLFMACGELFRVDIKQSGSWVVLRCICWACAADFSRCVIFMSPFFLTSISSAGSIIVHEQLLCEVWNFKTASWASYLHPHCTIVLGVLCTFSDNLAWTGFHKQRSYSFDPWKEIMVLFLASAVLISFSTTKFNFGQGLFCPIMGFLDFLTSIWVTENAAGVGHKFVTQRPFRSWMSIPSALTSKTGWVSIHKTIEFTSESLVALLITAKTWWQWWDLATNVSLCGNASGWVSCVSHSTSGVFYRVHV